MPRLMIAALAVALPLAAGAQPRQADPQRGLVASYPLDGAAVDAVTRSRASQMGVRPVDGHDGARNGALWFDGARSAVNLGPSLAPARFTIAAWIRPDAVDRVQAIVSKIRNLQGHWARNFELRLDPGGRLFLHVCDGAAWQGVAGDRPIQAGRWTHVAAVYDGARAQLYVDGTRDGAPLLGGYQQTRTDVFIGARPEGGNQDGSTPSGPTYVFLGAIDDVRVWDRPLSEYELAMVAREGSEPPPYAQPAPPPPAAAPPFDAGPATLVAQYPFDGDAHDAMGRAEGRLVGTRPAEDRLGNDRGALAFGGKNFVDLGTRTEPARLTVALWIQPTRAGRAQVIFSKRESPQGGRDRYLELGLDPSGRVVFMVPSGSSVASSRPLQPGAWVHVAATFDGDRATLYLDGERAGEDRLDPFEPVTGPALVGARPDSAGRRAKFSPAFEGRMDDLRVYRGALQAREVAALARENGGSPRRGGGEGEADVTLVKVDRLLLRYDAACARGDEDALAKVEEQVVGELGQVGQAAGDRRVADRIRKASAEFGRLRGETDAMSLDRKRSALFDLSDALWNDLAQEFDSGTARPRPEPARY